MAPRDGRRSVENARRRFRPASAWAIATTLLLATGFKTPSASDGVDEAGRDGARGRAADSPAEIPPPGWKDVLLRVYNNIWEHRVLSIAGGMTFYTILAIFPGIAALVSLYGLFADTGAIGTNVNQLYGVLPQGGIQIIQDQIARLTAQPRGTLGLSFAVSLAFALWSANSAMTALFDALNIVYSEKEKRSLVRLYGQALGFTTAAIVFAILAIAAVVAVPPALNALQLGGEIESLIRIARWPILVIVVALALAVLYRYGPSRERARWRWISWGSAFAAAGWLGASLLFSWYAANFGSFNATYGSLGAIIGFMMWIWISSIVILIGGELDAEIEHQTAQDTTTGAPQPMGARGAAMADTLGPAQSD
ncbi:MAG: YihY/virulence factor BrkB family protein [Stellaceae bacterium]